MGDKLKFAVPVMAVLATLMSGCVLDPVYAGGYPDGGYTQYPPVQGGGYYPDNGYGQSFRCESNDNRQRQCSVDTRGGVQLVRQLSKTQCVQGRNWGWDRNGVWVNGGCRGEFVAGRGGGGYYPGNGSSYGQSFRCESNDNRQRQCSVDTRGGVQLVRQLSKTQCVQGRNWGWDRNGVWVTGGCRAEFVTGRGGNNGHYPGNGNGGNYGQTLRCESNDNRQRTCPATIRRGVQLTRQLSKTQCVQGRNWGWSRSSVWVSGGCRAEFRID
ncbi:MAG: DUF3011 domain-containing protein [Pseudoxanthomonas sp.]